MSEIHINDGNGLLDNFGMIDSLIVDCNNLVKYLFNGQYVAFSASIVEMVQKLSNLKTGVKQDLDDKDRQIAEMQRLNDELAEKIYNLPAERNMDGQGYNSEERSTD